MFCYWHGSDVPHAFYAPCSTSTQLSSAPCLFWFCDAWVVSESSRLGGKWPASSIIYEGTEGGWKMTCLVKGALVRNGAPKTFLFEQPDRPTSPSLHKKKSGHPHHWDKPVQFKTFELKTSDSHLIDLKKDRCIFVCDWLKGNSLCIKVWV